MMSQQRIRSEKGCDIRSDGKIIRYDDHKGSNNSEKGIDPRKPVAEGNLRVGHPIGIASSRCRWSIGPEAEDWGQKKGRV